MKLMSILDIELVLSTFKVWKKMNLKKKIKQLSNSNFDIN